MTPGWPANLSFLELPKGLPVIRPELYPEQDRLKGDSIRAISWDILPKTFRLLTQRGLL